MNENFREGFEKEAGLKDKLRELGSLLKKQVLKPAVMYDKRTVHEPNVISKLLGHKRKIGTPKETFFDYNGPVDKLFNSQSYRWGGIKGSPKKDRARVIAAYKNKESKING